MTKRSVRSLDPETLCTRVVARLIEEIACVDIAPDSPVWSDLTNEGEVIGELRMYRGRGRLQKIVSCRYGLGSPSHEAHSVMVFTQPESAVPHFALDSVRAGSEVHLYVDLLPKRDLAVSPAYLDRCYEPLSAVAGELEQDPRFRPTALSLRQRVLLSPWHALYSVDLTHLAAAEGYVERFVSHWASLFRSNNAELESSPELAVRDISFRRIFFNRATDPTWVVRDRAIGRETVDRILDALAS